MADHLLDLTTFVRVVETGSLTAAARELRASLAVVSRRLARLEQRLGIRLVNRTTRRLKLTDEGAAFHARCVRVLAELEEAEAEVTRGRDTATGLLRVTSTVAFGRRLAALLLEFRAAHPGLRIHLDASDSVADVVEGGYDLAVRFGALADSRLIARQLAPNVRVVCAAPAYLDRRGRPTRLEDLRDHDCITHGDPPVDEWTFAGGKRIRVNAALTTNNGELAHAWALQGAGLVLKSIWDVRGDLDAGRLEAVLPDLAMPAAPIHAIYPHARHVAAKVRLCVEFLAARLGAEAATAVNVPPRRTLGPRARRRRARSA